MAVERLVELRPLLKHPGRAEPTHPLRGAILTAHQSSLNRKFRLAISFLQERVRRMEIITHAPSTAHFKCVCGERLVFSVKPGAFRALANLKRDGNLTIGRCPLCSRMHSVLTVAYMHRL